MSSSFILTLHLISITVFLVLYFLKLFFLLRGKFNTLEQFTTKTRVAEIIFATLFLGTGIGLLMIVGGIKSLQIVKLALIFSSIPIGIIGFRRKNKIVALLSFVMLMGADVLAEIGHKKLFPIKHAPESLAGNALAEGEFIFENNCVYCHGADGKKMYRDATDLSLPVKNESMTEVIIRNGSNKTMPSYGSLLSDEEIQSVTQYLMKLRVQ